MKYSSIFTSAILVSTALAAYVPSEPWSTLTPEAPAPTGAKTDHTHKFGIQIKTISAASAVKRDVDQIGDGQIQQKTSVKFSPVPTPTVVNQIGDGQIQHQTTATVVNQIGDGQIQHQTTATVVNQIGDGQIQHQTTATVINQIGDGQIQHQTKSVVNQIGDGQIQHQTKSVINQIGDGQIQHQTTASGASQIGDGQVQQPTGAPSPDSPTDGSTPKACGTDNSLYMELKSGVLTDSHGRLGAIVANRQFQFDGPPPQAGTIYAGGWSVTKEGNLAIGDNDNFFQCQSGDFYNLYDQSIGAQCSDVKLSIIDLIKC